MDSIESELRGLLSDTFNRSKLLGMLKEMQTETEKKEERKARAEKKVPQAPVTRYVEIKRNYICRHCGAHYSDVIKISHKDDNGVPIINKDGNCTIITSSSPAEIDCFLGFCKYCDGFISRLSKEELACRYSKLLSKYALLTHVEYVHKESNPTTEVVKVRW